MSLAESLLEYIKKAQVIPLSGCGVVKEGKERYKIYLPQRLNTLWEALRGRKVEVWIILK